MEVNREFCLGCGEDLQVSRERRKLGSDSVSGSGSRESVFAEWKILISNEVQVQGIPYYQVFRDQENPGKMCKKCFRNFKKLCKISSQLRANLALPVEKLCPVITCSRNLASSSSGITSDSTPTRKRRCYRPNFLKLVSPETTGQGSGSPTVVVNMKLYIYIYINMYIKYFFMNVRLT